MNESQDTNEAFTGCEWGCLAAFLLAVGLAFLGFGLVAKGALLATFVLALVGALRSGQFEWTFPVRPLRRVSHPITFWCNAAFVVFLACVVLWSFIQGLRELPS